MNDDNIILELSRDEGLLILNELSILVLDDNELQKYDAPKPLADLRWKLIDIFIPEE